MLIKPWHVLMEENPGGDAGGGGGGDADAGGVESVPEPTMLDAINQGLKYEEPPEEQAEAKAAEEKAAIETKIAAGDQEAIKAKAEADAAAKAEAAKPKDLKALELTDAEKKALPVKTAERINSLLDIAKTERTRAETAEQQAAALTEARQAILGVLKETNTSDQDLAQLLEFNRMVKSGTPQGYEGALAVVEQQRLGLLKLLGREGQGYDPLAEHQDLSKDVAEQKITKERALEIVAARKREALTAANANRGNQEQQAQAQKQQAVQEGLAGIEKWAAEKSKTDIDYKAKEEKILAEIQGIVKDYPPNLWLPTINRLYAGIVISKAAALPTSGKQPLRSSGAKPGGPAPTTMAEAIDQGLGYAKK